MLVLPQIQKLQNIIKYNKKNDPQVALPLYQFYHAILM